MIQIYDTTLRDGTQREGISLSCDDKLRIARKLDDLGVAFIEGGWPGSNPKDAEFFDRAKDMTWQHALIAAFGSTCRVGGSPEDDANIKALLDAQHAGLHRRRQDVDAARHRSAAHDLRREPAHHRAEPRLSARARPPRDL